MLILTRRLGEALKVNDETTITVLSLKGNHVRLGIEAPKEVIIHRREVYDRIKAKEKTEEHKDMPL